MLRRDLVIIGLSPSWLRVAVQSGRRIGKVEAISLDPTAWDDTWAKSLRPLDQNLKDALTRLGVSPGAWADIVYQSPQSAAEVFSFPTSGKGALAAAELSLRESLPITGVAWSSRLKQVHLDQQPESGGSPARAHVLCIAETESNADSLDGWVRRAGLNTNGILPAKAGKLGLAVKAAAALPKTGTHAIIWMGEHATVFAGTSEGRLAFVRSVDFGYWLLCDAIIRASASLSPASRPHRSNARRILFESGIPARGSLIDIASGLRAETALPLMQSVLQRYAVETKQTLRFSLSESEYPRVSLLLAGPGSQIPNLAAMLGNLFDVSVEVLEEEKSGGVKPVDRDGEVILALRAGCQHLTMVPPCEVGRRYGKKLDSALRVGGIAAVLALCSLGAWTFGESKALDRRFEELAVLTDSRANHEVQRERAVRLAGDVSSATQTITQTLGDRPRWDAVLGALSRLNGDAIELSEVSGSYPSDAKNAPVLAVRGTAWPTVRAGGAGGDTLSDFLDRLAKSPLVASAKVVSTRSSVVRGVEIKSFIVAIQLRVLPPSTTAKGNEELTGMYPGNASTTTMVTEEGP